MNITDIAEEHNVMFTDSDGQTIATNDGAKTVIVLGHDNKAGKSVLVKSWKPDDPKRSLKLKLISNLTGKDLEYAEKCYNQCKSVDKTIAFIFDEDWSKPMYFVEK
jgi:hypothetical protein